MASKVKSLIVSFMLAAVALSAHSAAAASKEETFVRKTVSSHDIVIFSKSYCPYCKRAKAVFRELKKETHVVELDQRAYFLNPKYHFARRLWEQNDLKLAVHEVYARLFPDGSEAANFGNELLTFKDFRGLFASMAAVQSRDKMMPYDGREIQDALSEIIGRRTVPQVFIKGKHIGGSDDTVEAYESGKLAKLLGISSNEDL